MFLDKYRVYLGYSFFLLFFILLTRFMLGKSVDLFNYSVFILILGSIAFFKIGIIKNYYLIVFSISGFLFITLFDWFFGRVNEVPLNEYNYYFRLINQFLWVTPFFLLPTIFKYYEIKEDVFFKVLFLFLIIFLPYVFYNSVLLGFDRNNLFNFFDPILIYDIIFMMIGIIIFYYSFLLNGVKSYTLLLLSLAVILTLVLHGTRSSWMGLPVAFIIIFLNFYRAKKNIFFLSIGSSLVFMMLNLWNEDSSFYKRIQNFKQDTIAWEQNNYQTSSGLRLKMWEESLKIYNDNKLYGSGVYKIKQHTCNLKEKGEMPQCFQHFHNLFFHLLATNGIIGIIGLFLIFLSSSLFFLKEYIKNSSDLEKRSLPLLGLVLVLYYFICGMAEYSLFFPLPTFIFFLLIGTIFSFLVNRDFE